MYQMGFTGRLVVTIAQVVLANKSFLPSFTQRYETTEIMKIQKNGGIGLLHRSHEDSRKMVGPPHLATAMKTAKNINDYVRFISNFFYSENAFLGKIQ